MSRRITWPSQGTISYANVSSSLRPALMELHKERGPAYPTSLNLGSGKTLRKTMRRQAHVYT